MRLLVIGGSGLIGSHVMRAAQANGHNVVGTFRERPEATLEQLDAARLEDFEKLLNAHQPEAVIHAAGWTWVDGCEDDPERALEENCHQPVRMAALCHSRGIRFVFFSTSYVFDGAEGPYDEDSKPAPINMYARSKWNAEQQLKEITQGEALIARVICVYGEEARRKNFAYQICDAMRQGKILRLPSDQCGNPTWAGDIAQALIHLLEQSATGIWHLGGPNPECMRIEWAQQLIASFIDAGMTLHPEFKIEAVPTFELRQKALRPLHAGMISRRLAEPTLSSRVDRGVFRRIADS